MSILFTTPRSNRRLARGIITVLVAVVLAVTAGCSATTIKSVNDAIAIRPRLAERAEEARGVITDEAEKITRPGVRANRVVFLSGSTSDETELSNESRSLAYSLSDQLKAANLVPGDAVTIVTIGPGAKREPLQPQIAAAMAGDPTAIMIEVAVLTLKTKVYNPQSSRTSMPMETKFAIRVYQGNINALTYTYSGTLDYQSDYRHNTFVPTVIGKLQAASLLPTAVNAAAAK